MTQTPLLLIANDSTGSSQWVIPEEFDGECDVSNSLICIHYRSIHFDSVSKRSKSPNCANARHLLTEKVKDLQSHRYWYHSRLDITCIHADIIEETFDHAYVIEDEVNGDDDFVDMGEYKTGASFAGVGGFGTAILSQLGLENDAQWQDVVCLVLQYMTDHINDVNLESEGWADFLDNFIL